MEYQTIVNPTTNRRVSIHGRLGRRILRNYLAHWQRGGGDQDEVTETGKEGNTWNYHGQHTAKSFCDEVNDEVKNNATDWLNRKINIIHDKDGSEALLQKKGRIIIPEDADVPCIYDEETAKLSVIMDIDDDPTTEPLKPGMTIQLLTKDSTDD
jgi:hypothetical protein